MGPGRHIAAIALTALVAFGSLLVDVVTWVHYAVVFSVGTPGRDWNFTKMAHMATITSMAAVTDDMRKEGMTKDEEPTARPARVTEPPEEQLERCAPIAVTDTYVINMDDMPDRYNSFMQHIAALQCGFDIERVHRHSGIVATNALIEDDWVRDLIPGVKGEASVRLGSLGLALAHLTLWDKILKSERCAMQGAEDTYALIFEDDERPRPFFADALNQVVRLIQQTPKEARPDMVNLNVKRPKGRTVKTMTYPQRIMVMEVSQKVRTWRTGPLCGELHCNVWMSAYMVRCGGIPDLINHGGRYPDGAHIYNGVTPTFDRQMSDVQSDGRTPVRGWSIAPENIISYHREGFDARKKRDAEAAQKALAEGKKRPILNSNEYVHEEGEEFEGFEWH